MPISPCLWCPFGQYLRLPLMPVSPCLGWSSGQYLRLPLMPISLCLGWDPPANNIGLLPSRPVIMPRVSLRPITSIFSRPVRLSCHGCPSLLFFRNMVSHHLRAHSSTSETMCYLRQYCCGLQQIAPWEALSASLSQQIAADSPIGGTICCSFFHEMPQMEILDKK